MLLVIPVKFLHLDVVAVLFSLLDHVNDHGPTISTPCTSKGCTWNKGKKREKNPQRLSNVQYPSKRKLGSSSVIDFDPRPKSFRRVKRCHINGLVKICKLFHKIVMKFQCGRPNLR